MSKEILVVGDLSGLLTELADQRADLLKVVLDWESLDEERLVAQRELERLDALISEAIKAGRTN